MTLPDELLTVIVQYTVDEAEADLSSEYPHLARLCLVSRILLPIARAALYHTLTWTRRSTPFHTNSNSVSDSDPLDDVDADSDVSEATILGTLRDNLHLAEMVKELALEVGGEDPKQEDMVSQLLGICHHLNEVTVLGSVGLSLGGVVTAFNRSGRLLKKLHVAQSSFLASQQPRAHKVALARFFDRQTQMEDLELMDYRDSALEAFTEAPMWKLQRLSCYTRHFHHFTLFSQSSLTSLTLYIPPIFQYNAGTVPSLAPFVFLRYLTVVNRHHRPPVNDFHQQLHQLLPTAPHSLTSLCLINYFNFYLEEADSRTVLLLVPRTITALDISLAEYLLAGSQVLQWIPQAAQQSLRQLIVSPRQEDLSTESEKSPGDPTSLREAGAKLGIQVIVQS